MEVRNNTGLSHYIQSIYNHLTGPSWRFAVCGSMHGRKRELLKKKLVTLHTNDLRCL